MNSLNNGLICICIISLLTSHRVIFRGVLIYDSALPSVAAFAKRTKGKQALTFQNSNSLEKGRESLKMVSLQDESLEKKNYKANFLGSKSHKDFIFGRLLKVASRVHHGQHLLFCTTVFLLIFTL